jgi:hypothetical protein
MKLFYSDKFIVVMATVSKDGTYIFVVLTYISGYYSKRLLGFSLYVSNTTNKAQGKLCFRDTKYTSDTIPAILDITCPVHGRYVIYYNERLSGVTYPSSYSEYAYNSFCEVEVYGMYNHYTGSNVSTVKFWRC